MLWLGIPGHVQQVLGVDMGVCMVSLWEKRQPYKTQENKQKLQTTQMHQQSASGPNTPLAKKKGLVFALFFELACCGLGAAIPQMSEKDRGSGERLDGATWP